MPLVRPRAGPVSQGADRVGQRTPPRPRAWAGAMQRTACDGVRSPVVAPKAVGAAPPPPGVRCRKGMGEDLGGGSFEPPKGGAGGVWVRGSRDRPVPRGQSTTCDDDSPTAPRSSPADCFFKKNFPHDTSLKMIRASRGIILSHMCCGTSGPPPPVSPFGGLGQPVGGPPHGSPEGGGGGARTTPPPPHTPISLHPRPGWQATAAQGHRTGRHDRWPPRSAAAGRGMALQWTGPGCATGAAVIDDTSAAPVQRPAIDSGAISH